MKKLFGVKNQTVGIDLALFVMRLVCGYAFIRYGWFKMQDPMHWMGPSSVPGIFQASAAVSEFGGGIALVAGFLTRLGAIGLACVMIVAIYMQKFTYNAPFVDLQGGNSYVLAASFLAIALLMLANGPGRFSLDRAVFGVRS
ncbi:MAG TPA: DoxX family protein [Blastocatellia bacterium]|nr:DoxX family protein [Blastocatellia bacterium]